MCSSDLLGVIQEVIQRKGGWFYFGDRKWQGIESVIASIREEIDLKQELEHLVLSNTSNVVETSDGDE